MTTPTQQLRDLLASHETADNWRLFRMALDLMDVQQEQINNLRKAVEQQAEKLAGRTSQLDRRISKLEGVHGA